jgi:hypothetical protein
MDSKVLFILGVLLGYLIFFAITIASGGKSAYYWHNRLIEAELAEFTVDSTTGNTTFIIYAEQPTK